MKSKIIILILAILLVAVVKSFSQGVPDTDNFKQSDVETVIGGSYKKLSELFTNSNAAYFDATYGSKTMNPQKLSGFRNYTVETCPNIGDTYLGGVVAYKYVSGDPGYVSGECHGIIVTSADLGQYNWYDGSLDYWNLGATNTALGTGVTNTNLIYSLLGIEPTSQYAAEICHDLTQNTYTDWVLPSYNEIYKIYLSSLLGVNKYYWSSTEIDATNAYSLYTGTGTFYSVYMGNDSGYVRAIRYF